MNILNITTITELRGGDIQMHTIYGLLQEFHDLNQYILCPKDSDLFEIYGKNDPNFITYDKKDKIFSSIKTIIKTVKDKKIDVIHIHDSSALTATLLASVFIPKTVKIILSRKRDKKIKKNFLGKIKYGSSRIEKVICVSNAVASIFEDVITDPTKVITIYDAIDVSKFSNSESKGLIAKELGFSSGTKIIGNVVALENQKDLLTFVDTAERIKEKNPNEKIQFVIVGGGSKKEEIESYIHSKNLADYVHLMGFRKNIKELLPEFDMLVMTSISEGLPLSVYEAFASRIPVISTKAGGIPEVVIEDETGFLAEIKDSKRLAEHINTMLRTPGLSEKITENAYKIVKERFDLPVLRDNYYQLYKSLG